MFVALLSGFLLALLVPVLHRLFADKVGWVLALLPIGQIVYLLQFAETIASGQAVVQSHSWVESLSLRLDFYLDGLSLLFALLITVIGALVLIYAGGYLKGHRQLPNFYVLILLFMASMLGVVLAGNLLLLYVFWELTTLTSYLLIGFDHERTSARAAALQALLVTGFGGLSLLAGLLMTGMMAESFEFLTLFGAGVAAEVDPETVLDVRTHALYVPALLLILLGAFTKSAQFPFHFWLPNAMEAPTPVSAYLHSATMVKAGVYLLARMHPLVGGTDLWLLLVSTAGAVTMVLGAYLSTQQSDLKRILAYSTLSVLGLLVLMLGLGTAPAITAGMVFLLAHAMYKGGLFLMAGSVDHGTGTRDVSRLGGLWQLMPFTAAGAILGSLSMAGVLPMFGFVAKEIFYEAVWEAPQAAGLLTSLAILTGVFLVVASGLVCVKPFFGMPTADAEKAHEANFGMWIGPVLLGTAALILGVVPGLVAQNLIAPSVAAVAGYAVPVKLVLWHGFNLMLGLSLLTLALGIVLYAGRNLFSRLVDPLRGIAAWGPSRGYEFFLVGLNGVARGQTRILQNGYLRYYVLIIIVVTVASVAYTLTHYTPPEIQLNWGDIRFHELLTAFVILAAALFAIQSESRLAAIASLGVVGYGVALIFVLFGAPDLAMTQFVIETLTVILFVFVFQHLPKFGNPSSRTTRFRDFLVALTAGSTLTMLLLVATATRIYPSISEHFSENSVSLAHGRNIVNVILVDFRGIDTMGEITVLAIAGIGVYALLKQHLVKKDGGR